MYYRNMNVITRSLGCGFSIGVGLYVAHWCLLYMCPELRVSEGTASRTSPVGCLMCAMRQVRGGGGKAVVRTKIRLHPHTHWCCLAHVRTVSVGSNSVNQQTTIT